MIIQKLLYKIEHFKLCIAQPITYTHCVSQDFFCKWQKFSLNWIKKIIECIGSYSQKLEGLLALGVAKSGGSNDVIPGSLSFHFSALLSSVLASFSGRVQQSGDKMATNVYRITTFQFSRERKSLSQQKSRSRLWLSWTSSCVWPGVCDWAGITVRDKL